MPNRKVKIILLTVGLMKNIFYMKMSYFSEMHNTKTI